MGSNHSEAKTDTTEKSSITGWGRLQTEQGAMGYIVLWFLGVPASVLFLIFLVRGCN